jgi:hypothetical protein
MATASPSAGPYQTVDISPANSAAITVQGASAVQSYRGLVFHPEAFTFGCADLEMYENQHIMEMAADKELGLAIRMWAMPDINTDRLLMRLDVLGGWLTMYPARRLPRGQLVNQTDGERRCAVPFHKFQEKREKTPP